MKKTTQISNLSLAACAALLAAAPAAQAQSSVTLFTLVDVNVSHYSAGSRSGAGSMTAMNDGTTNGLNGSRWGIRTVEDLGGGLKAGVLLENFAGTDTLRALLPRLGELSQHEDARVRADACHYLGLTGDAAARPWLEARLTDEDADVREIAAESLQTVTSEGR